MTSSTVSSKSFTIRSLGSDVTSHAVVLSYRELPPKNAGRGFYLLRTAHTLTVASFLLDSEHASLVSDIPHLQRSAADCNICKMDSDENMEVEGSSSTLNPPAGTEHAHEDMDLDEK